MNEIILLIPSLNPEESLIKLINDINMLNWNGPILLVDDGSNIDGCRDIFFEAEKLGCDVVHHARNLGKGRALKTGFNEVLVKYPEAIGVVTADADGQHIPEDIIKCRDELLAHPDDLILGCRDFDKDNVPIRSQIGNKFTRFSMKTLCGVAVTDTQTGLRGIPRKFMLEMLDLVGERFDFETNMLLETKNKEVKITEYSISTVYFEQNRKSNYNTIKDSIRIFKILFKFCLASVIGFGVDIIAFTLLLMLFKFVGLKDYSIAAATFVARVISATVNYLMNHKVVFKSKKDHRSSGIKYALLCVIQLSLSALFVTLLYNGLGGIETLWKILVDFILFFISFQIQRNLIF